MSSIGDPFGPGDVRVENSFGTSTIAHPYVVVKNEVDRVRMQLITSIFHTIINKPFPSFLNENGSVNKERFFSQLEASVESSALTFLKGDLLTEDGFIDLSKLEIVDGSRLRSLNPEDVDVREHSLLFASSFPALHQRMREGPIKYQTPRDLPPTTLNWFRVVPEEHAIHRPIPLRSLPPSRPYATTAEEGRRSTHSERATDGRISDETRVSEERVHVPHRERRASFRDILREVILCITCTLDAIMRYFRVMSCG